jgi:hypothetical protein
MACVAVRMVVLQSALLFQAECLANHSFATHSPRPLHLFNLFLQAPNGLAPPYVSPDTGAIMPERPTGANAPAAPHDKHLAAPPSPVLGGEDFGCADEAGLALAAGADALGGAPDEMFGDGADMMENLVVGHPVASLRADTPLQASTPPAPAARGRRGVAAAKAVAEAAAEEGEVKAASEEEDGGGGGRRGKMGRGNDKSQVHGAGSKGMKASSKHVRMPLVNHQPGPS